MFTLSTGIHIKKAVGISELEIKMIGEHTRRTVVVSGVSTIGVLAGGGGSNDVA